MKKFETPNGKEIAMVICPKTAHIKLQFTSGGELPVSLSGLYTSETDAMRDILVYIETLKVKAETKTTKKETTKEE